MSETLASSPPLLRRPRNLAQALVEAITSEIQAGTLKPGEKLPSESLIMAKHGVSRTVVREAISHLQANKLVQTRHGIGTFVLEPATTLSLGANTVMTIRDVLAVLELRISLETEAAWLAASRRTPEQVRELRQSLDAMRAHHGESGPEAVEADVRFHQLIAQATGNRYFEEILRDLGNAIIPRARLNTVHLANVDPASFHERVAREHDDIFNAIERQDPEASRAAMRTHLSNSRERLRQAQETLEASLAQA
ncbi:FadR/GntR family transcriptional regulator [Roseateles sp.]|uniref:FadR/GntR family transcriptional regulator n=1 Tax=Roseateles sp. TaxID=1971397 RepID=UPI0025CF52AF|nr:FadR/GntR family transcriptional regulator [Roseateles sp.]MBV8037225.1 FadR family transcriptional regulator [Roseateles sp.]